MTREKPIINITPDELRLLLETGYLYMHMNRLKEAKEVFEGIIPLAPKNEVVYTSLANTLYALGQTDEAEKYYKIAIQLNPNNTFTLANYGDLLLFKGEIQKGKELLHKVIELAPNSPDANLATNLLKGYNIE